MLREAYSAQEFADRHGISRMTVYNLINRGQLEALKIGRLTKITKDQEAAWLASLPRIGGIREARNEHA